MRDHNALDRITGVLGGAALILGLCGAGAAGADGVEGSHGDTLIDDAFSLTTARHVHTLGEAAMDETEGERWPSSFSEAVIDRPLATFSGVTVVPEITRPWGGGVCTSCAWRNRLPR